MNIEILDIPNYPIKKSLISFYDLKALKRQIDISMQRNNSYIYQSLQNFLENLLFKNQIWNVIFAMAPMVLIYGRKLRLID